LRIRRWRNTLRPADGHCPMRLQRTDHGREERVNRRWLAPSLCTPPRLLMSRSGGASMPAYRPRAACSPASIDRCARSEDNARRSRHALAPCGEVSRRVDGRWPFDASCVAYGGSLARGNPATNDRVHSDLHLPYSVRWLAVKTARRSGAVVPRREEMPAQTLQHRASNRDTNRTSGS
jgi:hypothetical protein